MLKIEQGQHNKCKSDSHKTRTGLPADPPGKDISMTLLAGNEYIEPFGRSSSGVCAPLVICNNTGVDGDLNETLLTRKLWVG